MSGYSRLHTEYYTRVTRSKDVFHLKFREGGCTGRADEDRSDVGLDSGTLHITSLVKHLVMRLAILVSNDIRPTGLLGYPFNVLVAVPTRFIRSTTMTDIACDQTTQEMATIQWTKFPPPVVS